GAPRRVESVAVRQLQVRAADAAPAAVEPADPSAEPLADPDRALERQAAREPPEATDHESFGAGAQVLPSGSLQAAAPSAAARGFGRAGRHRSVAAPSNSSSQEPSMVRAPGSPIRRLVLVAASALIAAAPPQQRGPPPGPVGSFGEEHLWDDGKAEISQYAAEEIVEGEKRSFDAWTIVVAEMLDPTQMTKKEGWKASYVPVLKCNWFLEIPTGVYRYHQMASLFLRRSDMLAMKVAFSSSEWCGANFCEWRRDRPGFLVHSYWDGEGDQ